MLLSMSKVSTALQYAFGDGLRSIIKASCSNRIFAFASGAMVCALLNSSNAASLLVVHFVASGDMTLAQALGFCLGINVGGTVQSHLVASSTVADFGEAASACPLPILCHRASCCPAHPSPSARRHRLCCLLPPLLAPPLGHGRGVHVARPPLLGPAGDNVCVGSGAGARARPIVDPHSRLFAAHRARRQRPEGLRAPRVPAARAPPGRRPRRSCRVRPRRRPAELQRRAAHRHDVVTAGAADGGAG